MPPRTATSAIRIALTGLCTLAPVASACSDAGPPSAPSATSAPSEAVVVRDKASAVAAIGRRVRVRGTAQNGKLAALVVSGDLLVYCLDRVHWPADLDGKLVEAEGVLERTDQFAAVESPDGLISQGTGGADFVLRRSSVRAAGE